MDRGDRASAGRAGAVAARLERGFGLLLYTVAALAVIGALGGLYYKVSNDGYQRGKGEVQGRWDEANRVARAAEEKKAQAAATKTEAVRVEIRYRTKTITKEVDKIVDRPVYRNVCLDADGLRLARCAIRGQSADTCKPDKPVPGATLSLRWDWGDRLALGNRSLGSLP